MAWFRGEENDATGDELQILSRRKLRVSKFREFLQYRFIPKGAPFAAASFDFSMACVSSDSPKIT